MLGFSDSSIGVVASLLLHVGVAAACFGALGDGHGVGQGVVLVSLHGPEASVAEQATPDLPDPQNSAKKVPVGPVKSMQEPVPPLVSTPAKAQARERQDANVPTSQPERAAPQASAAPGGGGLLGTLFAAPVALHVPKPEYPSSARRRGVEGTVLLKLTISETGAVTNASVDQTSGVEALDESALKAVREATFRPGLRAGVPHVANKTISVQFSLTE